MWHLTRALDGHITQSTDRAGRQDMWHLTVRRNRQAYSSMSCVHSIEWL